MKSHTKPEHPFVRIFSQKKSNRNLPVIDKLTILVTYSLIMMLILHVINSSLVQSAFEHSFSFTRLSRARRLEPKIKLGLQLLCVKVVKSNQSCIRNCCKPKTSKMKLIN